jgi:hypothetical protein
MSRPRQFEHFKRNQVVHDLDNATDACGIAEIVAAETYLAFGPDTVVEARNRCYKPCPHCIGRAGASGEAA